MIPFARFVGNDSDHFEFIMPSFTDKSSEYSLFVCKRTGSIFCSCKDAFYRAKEGDVINPTNNQTLTCKHIRRLQHQFGEALKP